MNAGKYNLGDFLKNYNLEQIIVPEIQRDYVWKAENVNKLLTSILDNNQKQSKQEISDEELEKLSPALRDKVSRELKKTINYCNIGFLYAYSDSEMPGRYILIDGQQRMTTLFLLLLSLSVKEDKQDRFKNAYFKDEILKFDYKVRASAHDFMVNFVKHILDKKNIDAITDQYWYFTGYDQDVTIQSIIANYITIQSFMAKNEISLQYQYIENYIEFWYFDTKKSEQGEELYIYMNSRGEQISPNEGIKAILLKDLPDNEKRIWGEKWETWQDFFWKHRKANASADMGLNEFLRWIDIVGLITSQMEKSIEDQARKIRQIKEQDEVGIERLSFPLIETYFDTLSKLFTVSSGIHLNDGWLAGKLEAIDYVRLLPVMLYIKEYPDFSKVDLRRFGRFFSNVIRFPTISGNPHDSLVSAIRLTRYFLYNNKTDVVDLIEYRSDFTSILTGEEVAKLSIYKQSDEALRFSIERAFWEAEDFYLCNGRIDFIWECMSYDKSAKTFTNIDVETFTAYFDSFKTLFVNPDDLLRRALLTKGDYKIWDGFSTSLWADRYSFYDKEGHWAEQFARKHDPLIKAANSLVNDFRNRKSKEDDAQRGSILKGIISDYLDADPPKNWLYYIIKNPEILAYCRQKYICFGGTNLNEIFLLEEKRAYSWKELQGVIEPV
jgi:uncharacterized protein with ParB-like and HNH nuclease domain